MTPFLYQKAEYINNSMMCWGYFSSMEASLGQGNFNNTVVWKSVLIEAKKQLCILRDL